MKFAAALLMGLVASQDDFEEGGADEVESNDNVNENKEGPFKGSAYLCGSAADCDKNFEAIYAEWESQPEENKVDGSFGNVPFVHNFAMVPSKICFFPSTRKIVIYSSK